MGRREIADALFSARSYSIVTLSETGVDEPIGERPRQLITCLLPGRKGEL
jgi:hypothetical protein